MILKSDGLTRLSAVGVFSPWPTAAISSSQPRTLARCGDAMPQFTVLASAVSLIAIIGMMFLDTSAIRRPGPVA